MKLNVVNETGLAAVTAVVPVDTYRAGQIAGFAPEKAYTLIKQDLFKVTPKDKLKGVKFREIDFVPAGASAAEDELTVARETLAAQKAEIEALKASGPSQDDLDAKDAEIEKLKADLAAKTGS
ncbi:MAG: hypothetical protein AAF468_20160 [Pseudomonadota bacterium]